MAYKLVTPKGKNALGKETFGTKKRAIQSKVHMIVGAANNGAWSRAQTYSQYTVRKANKKRKRR